MPRVRPPPEGNAVWQRFSRLSAVKGGTFGLQIGGQAADVVLVFLNQNAPRLIAASSFDLGGQASVAAGPVGRNLSAETDYKLTAEIYTYSKTKGLFAGINLAGTKWEIDSKANKAVYGGSRSADVKGLLDRKSTRLNSSHSQISYAVFCLKKKKKTRAHTNPA